MGEHDDERLERKDSKQTSWGWFGGGSASQSGDDFGEDFLDAVERLRERLRLAIVELDLLARSGAVLQPDRFADNEGNRFGFGLADGLAVEAVLAVVE